MTRLHSLFALAFLTACAPKDGAPAGNQATPSILASLPTMTIRIDLVESGVVTLVNGRFEQPAAPGSAEMVQLSLGQQRVTGDLDADGAADAAVTLLASTGGTGSFTYVAAVLDKAGKPAALPAILIGDRIEVTGLAIEDGMVVVTVLDRAPGQAMAEAPTVTTVRRFTLRHGALVEGP